MDGYNDLLEDIKKQGGELMWITKKKEFLENSNKRVRTPEQIKQEVLQSVRLKYVIDQILLNKTTSNNNGTSTNNSANLKREDLQNEAKLILDEMAHLFDLKYVRMLGYALIKVVSKIYKHVYYNSDICSNLQVLKQYPTVFLPLHRSYMDFLLVSIICFHKNIQLPTIAAGQDFLGLSFLSEVIRRCGGFFIRRSFGSDQLYWAIFHQYVQEHLSNCDRPLEFFIEGTRSRTSKSLQPKQGMLATCLELYLKSHRVEDIYLVPISLTYERLLEELLYSNELLGIPKPKETVSGLMKARTILNECYGTIFINFARPISAREMLHQLEGPTLKNRTTHTLTPSFIFELNSEQLKTIDSFSYIILLDMLRNQVIQPISIISTCLLLCLNKSASSHHITTNNTTNQTKLFEWSRSISLDQLCIRIDKLKRILVNLGAKVYWPLEEINQKSNANSSNSTVNSTSETNRIKNLILDNLEIHSNLFNLYNLSNKSFKFNENLKLARESTIKSNSFIVSLKQPHKNLLSNATTTIINNNKSSKLNSNAIREASLFESASFYLALCSYRNQLVHFLVRISFVCISLLATSPSSASSTVAASSNINEPFELGFKDNQNAFEIYKFLSNLFNREFIFHLGYEQKDFNDSISYLLHTNLIKLDDDKKKFYLIKYNLEKFFFFSRLFKSFLQNYNEIYSVVLSSASASSRNRNSTISFNDEKQFTKMIQKKIFDKISQLNENNRSEINNIENRLALFDFEVLSLNLISNCVLSLRQFKILNKKINSLANMSKQNQTSNNNNNNMFEIDLTKLINVNDKLRYVIDSIGIKLNYLNQHRKEFDSLTLNSSESNDNPIDQYDELEYGLADSNTSNNDLDDLFHKSNQNRNFFKAKL